MNALEVSTELRSSARGARSLYNERVAAQNSSEFLTEDSFILPDICAVVVEQCDAFTALNHHCAYILLVGTCTFVGQVLSV